MGSEWTQTTVGSFCPFSYGKGLPEKKRIPNGRFIVYGSNGPVGTHDQPLVNEPGIVIGRKGTVGAVHFASKPFWPIDTTYYVLSASGRHLKYTYYLLKSIGLENMNADSAVPGLNRNAVHAKQILVPSYDEQHTIAQILGSLDDKIELNCRMNKTLEAIARAIFKSWFIDFDPVIDNALRAGNPIPDLMAERAEIRRQILDQNQPSSSSPISQRAKDWNYQEGFDFSGLGEVSIDEINGLFPDSFQDSELGAIPKGWEVKTIGSEFRLTMGQSPPGNTYNEIGNGLPFFQGRRDFGFRYPSHRVYCMVPQRLSYKGDTLVSVRAPVGNINMAMERCCIGRGVAGIRHMSNSRSYTYYAMHTLRGQFEKFEAEGTVFGAINKKQFEEIRWISPGENIISKFEKIAFAIDEQIEKNTIENNTLASLRDTLLPKLISGELRVPDVEKFVKEIGL